MELCNYASILKCEKCEHVFYVQCPKFMRYHNTLLIRDLAPFTFEKLPLINSDVFVSTNANRLKSIAAQYAIKLNKKIKLLTLNQAINITLTNTDILYDMVFLDCSNKISGDLEKITSVLESFIDTCQLQNIKVFLLRNTGIPVQKNWYKI